MPPLVSVLLPYRNAADTVEEAIGSLLAQTHDQLEIIATDDGSTDSGRARVAALAARDPRLIPHSTSGLGIARALQASLQQARGAFIARMDADDVSLPHRIAMQLRAMQTNPKLGVIGTQVLAFPDAAVGEGMKLYVQWLNGLITHEDHARELFVESPLCHPSVMLRREALEAVGGWRDVPWPEDYDLWLRLDAAGWQIAKVAEVLLHWRHQAGRATFADARYALERFREAKAEHLAARVRRLGRPLAVWGAGQTGKRTARALERHGLSTELFVDIDPRKIGRTARGAPIVSSATLRRGQHTVVAAVGARGARELIRQALQQAGFAEGDDFLFAS